MRRQRLCHKKRRTCAGFWDDGTSFCLFVVAIVNLNVVPTSRRTAGNRLALALGIAALFLPQGIAVIELAHRYPGGRRISLGETGIRRLPRLSLRLVLWTNNIFYVPTVLLYFVGISVTSRVRPPRTLADNPWFALGASMSFSSFLLSCMYAAWASAGG